MSKKTLRVHWRGEEEKSENTDGVQTAPNGILKNATVNTRKEVIPEHNTHTHFEHHINKKRVQNFVNPQDPKRPKQDFQNFNRVRQKQRAPLPPNVGSRTYNNGHVSAPSGRQVSSAGVPQQYVYLQQPGGSTRRYPPGYRPTQPHSAHNHVRSSRTLPPYRIVPPQLELLRMDDNSPQVRLGRYRPKVIQEHFSPNNVRDTEFLNKRREKSTSDKRKSEQTYTWEKQVSPGAKVSVGDGKTSTLRTKTIVRLKAPPSQPSVSEGRPKSTHISSVTIPPRASSTNPQDGENGNFFIVDYLVDNLAPQMLQMKLTENGDAKLNNGRPNGLLRSDNGHTSVTPQGVNSDSGSEMIEVQKQILQQRQSEVTLAQLPVS